MKIALVIFSCLLLFCCNSKKTKNENKNTTFENNLIFNESLIINDERIITFVNNYISLKPNKAYIAFNLKINYYHNNNENHDNTIYTIRELKCREQMRGATPHGLLNIGGKKIFITFEEFFSFTRPDTTCIFYKSYKHFVEKLPNCSNLINEDPIIWQLTIPMYSDTFYIEKDLSKIRT